MLISLTGILDDGSTHRASVPSDPRQTLNIPQGSDVTITVRIVTPAGNTVDLSGAGTEVLLTIKKNPKLFHDSWPRITKAATLAGNVATFQLEPGDWYNWAAGRYSWDVWLTKDGSRDAVIPTSPLMLLQSVAAVPARPPPPTLELVSNDTEPLVLDFSGTDISLWTITVHLAYSPTPLVKTATIVDGPGGIAQVEWSPGDLIPGVWGGEVQIIKPGPVTQTSDVFIADIRQEIA